MKRKENDECRVDRRKAVYFELDEERKYQDNLDWHTKRQDKEHSISDWIIFMETKLNQAKEATYQLNEEEALKQIKKVTTLGVACMEYNLIKKR